MVFSSTIFTGLVAALMMMGQIQAQGTQGGHTGGVQGKQELHIQVCKNAQDKCDWYMTLERGDDDAFNTHDASCDQWETPEGVNGVYKFKDFTPEKPLDELVVDVPKCDYYKMVSTDKITHPDKKTCHFYTAHVC
ncbi:unnamed protein product [Absidia cylindrospora]